MRVRTLDRSMIPPIATTTTVNARVPINPANASRTPMMINAMRSPSTGGWAMPPVVMADTTPRTNAAIGSSKLRLPKIARNGAASPRIRASRGLFVLTALGQR